MMYLHELPMYLTVSTVYDNLYIESADEENLISLGDLGVIIDDGVFYNLSGDENVDEFVDLINKPDLTKVEHIDVTPRMVTITVDRIPDDLMDMYHRCR